MLILHGAARSRAQRTLWMLFELGIPYEHDPLVPRSPGTKTPEFLALNPNSRLPVIEDDGFVLSESMAINFYLAKKHNSPLYPSNPRDEALALQWSFWETDRLDRNLADYLNHTALLPEAERNPFIAASSWAEVEPSLNVLNAALGKAPWLAGANFSVADLNVAAALWRLLSMDVSQWPAVKDWVARCWDRPAGKKARAAREG